LSIVLADGERWRVIEGDALAVLATLPNASFDAVVTDPPLGVRDDEEWDRMSVREFARFSMAWLSQARRVAGELVTFCPAYGPFRRLCEMLWPRVRVMFWDKPLGSQYAGAAERGLWVAHETILHCYTPKGCGAADAIATARQRCGLSRGDVDLAVRGKKTGLCYRWEEGACVPTPEQAEQLISLFRLNGEHSELSAPLRSLADGTKTTVAVARDVFSYRTETAAGSRCR
jgi:hypothetical protein